MIYPLDYGYIKGTTSGDGNELDVWQGIILQKRLEAVVCTVDLLKKDVEVKLLLGCTEEEKTQIYEFYKNSNCIAAIMIKREGN
jgi:inorganic pyrophosphatase